MLKRGKQHNDESNPSITEDIENDWESSRVQQIERSERKAWGVAFTATGVAVLCIICIVLMLPLKEVIPYLVRVDNATGVTDIVTRLTAKDIDFDEAIDKHWLTEYVIHRESYDWYLLQRDYDAVRLFSSIDEWGMYSSLFEGKEALDAVYSNKIKVTVNVISVVPNGNGIGTVRFTKTTKRTDDKSGSGKVEQWVATIAYQYAEPSLLYESERRINPMGFRVNSYRTDPELRAGNE